MGFGSIVFSSPIMSETCIRLAIFPCSFLPTRLASFRLQAPPVSVDKTSGLKSLSTKFRFTHMRTLTILFWLVGIALMTGLVAYQGVGNVGEALARSGWGLVVLCAYNVIPFAATAVCWQILLRAAGSLPLGTVLWIRWVGVSVNSLLPVAQVGGELLRVRLATLKGTRGPETGASVIVDVTLAIASQSVFVFMGIALFVYYYGFGETAHVAIVGIILFSLCVFGFYLAQRLGMFSRLAHRIEKIVKVGDWKTITGGAKALDEAVDEAYQSKGTVFLAGLWRMLGVILGTGQILVALYFLDRPIGIVEAIMLESMTHAVRNAAFMIPGALGVQEGGFMVLGAALGLGPETALALALLVRARTILFGLPALLFWQFVEGRLLLRSG